MASIHRIDDGDTDGDIFVPAGVIKGINDIAEGRTADGDDLDEALGL